MSSEKQNEMTSEEVELLIQMAMETSTLFTPDEIRQNPQLVAEVLGMVPPSAVETTDIGSETGDSVIEDQRTPNETSTEPVRTESAPNESVLPDPSTSAEADSSVPDEVKPKKQTRCGHPDCRRKIKIYDLKCKCGLFFCALHRYGTNSKQHAEQDNRAHFCSFDYHAEARIRLEKQLKGEGKINYHSIGHGGSNGGNMAC